MKLVEYTVLKKQMTIYETSVCLLDSANTATSSDDFRGAASDELSSEAGATDEVSFEAGSGQ